MLLVLGRLGLGQLDTVVQSRSHSALSELGSLGRAPQPFRASVSPSLKWGWSQHLPVGLLMWQRPRMQCVLTGCLGGGLRPLHPGSRPPWGAWKPSGPTLSEPIVQRETVWGTQFVTRDPPGLESPRLPSRAHCVSGRRRSCRFGGSRSLCSCRGAGRPGAGRAPTPGGRAAAEGATVGACGCLLSHQVGSGTAPAFQVGRLRLGEAEGATAWMPGA